MPAPVVALSAFVPLTFVDSLLLRCHFAFILHPLNDGRLARKHKRAISKCHRNIARLNQISTYQIYLIYYDDDQINAALMPILWLWPHLLPIPLYAMPWKNKLSEEPCLQWEWEDAYGDGIRKGSLLSCRWSIRFNEYIDIGWNTLWLKCSFPLIDACLMLIYLPISPDHSRRSIFSSDIFLKW